MRRLARRSSDYKNFLSLASLALVAASYFTDAILVTASSFFPRVGDF
jgi:hypothetical protein